MLKAEEDGYIVPDWILAALKAAALGWLVVVGLCWVVAHARPRTGPGRWLQRFAWGYFVAGGLMGSLTVVQQAQYLASRGIIPLDFRPLVLLFLVGVFLWPIPLSVIIVEHQY